MKPAHLLQACAGGARLCIGVGIVATLGGVAGVLTDSVEDNGMAAIVLLSGAVFCGAGLISLSVVAAGAVDVQDPD